MIRSQAFAGRAHRAADLPMVAEPFIKVTTRCRKDLGAARGGLAWGRKTAPRGSATSPSRPALVCLQRARAAHPRSGSACDSDRRFVVAADGWLGPGSGPLEPAKGRSPSRLRLRLAPPCACPPASPVRCRLAAHRDRWDLPDPVPERRPAVPPALGTSCSVLRARRWPAQHAADRPGRPIRRPVSHNSSPPPSVVIRPSRKRSITARCSGGRRVLFGPLLPVVRRVLVVFALRTKTEAHGCRRGGLSVGPCAAVPNYRRRYVPPR